MFDLSPIINQEDQAIRRWMTDTLAYAVISNNQEIPEDEVIRMVQNEVIAPFLPTKAISVKDLTTRTILVAKSKLQEEHDSDHSPAPNDALIQVNFWIMRTLAMVHIANEAPFHNEKLELEADEHVVARVQGNRRHARRADLDQLVRRTLEYAEGQLLVAA